MTSVAALYDIHGNLPALEAVLAEVGDAATIVVGGDFSRGPMPVETVDRLRGPRGARPVHPWQRRQVRGRRGRVGDGAA